jgi:hypothetical protein
MPWQEVTSELAAAPKGTVLTVARGALPPPVLEGALASTGLGPGPHWRFPADASCRGLHVRETPAGYEAHLDAVHPDCSVVRHLRADAPGLYVVLGTGIGAAAGGALKGSRGALVGAAVGFAASLFTR